MAKRNAGVNAGTVLIVSGAAASAGLGLAWLPGRDHPSNPVRLRGIFRLANRLARAYEAVTHQSLVPLDPAFFASEIANLKESENELWGSPVSESEWNGLCALLGGLDASDSLLSPLGKFLTLREIRNRLAHRRQVSNYVRANPEVLDIPLERPLIVTGLPRSGTSLLQGLLAQDPGARSPRLWEMRTDPFPRPAMSSAITAGSDPRQLDIEKAITSLGRLSPDYLPLVNQYHETGAALIDEEAQLLRDCMWTNTGGTYVGADDSYARWIVAPDQDKTYLYRYLKVWLQIQSSTYIPASHWVLKTPSHTYFLPVLAQIMPGANLVFTHRDPSPVVASSCKYNLLAGALRIDFSQYDPMRHGQRVLDILVLAADLIQAFVAGSGEVADRSVHVLYEDLLADPLSVVDRIYAHFGYRWSPVFEERMETYLADNRQYKHGKPDHSLDQFGLSEDRVQQAFAGYTCRFRQKVGV